MTEKIAEILLNEVVAERKWNEVLAEQFEIIAKRQRKIAKRQNCISFLIGLLTVIVLAGLFAYYTKTREMFFGEVREKMELLYRTRDSIRFDKEIFYRLQDTTEHYVRPMYDTIKIK